MPVTRPHGRAAFLVPPAVAAGVGLATGLAPHVTLLVAAAVVSTVVLVPRVDWAALAVIASAVFEGYLSALSPWAVDWLVALLAVAWLVRRAQGRLHEHRILPAVSAVLVLGGAVLLAFAVHPNGLPGVQVVAKYAELAVVMLVLADVLCGPLAPVRAARAYVLACVAASVCGLLTAVLNDRHQVVGPLANADTLAFFLLAALPLVGTVRTRQAHRRWWVGTSVALLLAAGMGTQSRPALGGLVVVVVVAVLSGLLALRHAGALLAVVMTGVALVIAVLPLPVGQAITDPQRYSESNVAQRNDMRLAAFDMVRDHPVVGLGPAAFAVLHQDYTAPDADPSSRDLGTAYSTPLEAAAELGLLGLLALYAAWLVPAAVARRRWLDDRSRLAAGTLLALDGALVAAVFETAQYVLPLWFLAAMTVALGRPERPRAPLFAPAIDDRTSGQVATGS